MGDLYQVQRQIFGLYDFISNFCAFPVLPNSKGNLFLLSKIISYTLSPCTTLREVFNPEDALVLILDYFCKTDFKIFPVFFFRYIDTQMKPKGNGQVIIVQRT